MLALSRKERDRRLRREDILRAAEHIFAIKGYHKASIQDIASEAQYAVGTVYLYFKDKEVLYTTLIEQKAQELILTVKNKVVQAKDIREKIKVLVEEHLSYFEKNEDFFRIYFSERSNVSWTVKHRIPQKTMEKFLNYLDYIASIIKAAQVEGVVRNDFPAQKMAYILASMLNAVIFPWLRKESIRTSSGAKPSGNGKTLKDMSGFILDMFFNGAKAK